MKNQTVKFTNDGKYMKIGDGKTGIAALYGEENKLGGIGFSRCSKAYPEMEDVTEETEQYFMIELQNVRAAKTLAHIANKVVELMEAGQDDE